MMTQETFRFYYRAAREAVRRRDVQMALIYLQSLLRGLSDSLKERHSPSYVANMKHTFLQLQQLTNELKTKGVSDSVLTFFSLPKSSASVLFDRSDGQGWCADIYARNKRAVVEIFADSGRGETSLGTGAIISPQGYLLTNDHIVYDEANDSYHDHIGFSFVDEDRLYPAELICSDPAADLALCRFDPTLPDKFSCVKRIADYATLRPGADLVLIGNFFGMGLSPINGIVRKVKNADGELEHSALSNEGDSGGPLFNRAGECVGINCSKTARVNGHVAEGIRNAVPMDCIDRLLSEWSAAHGITL